MIELYKKYRPKKLKHVIGNEGTVRSLTNMLERNTLPHAMLFHGPSGCGKTTLTRILKDELQCSDLDFKELNCSDTRGIDTIRDIVHKMHLAPAGGKCRIWLLDECHALSKDAMNSLLKPLEDTPSHVYFFLATTEPQKLLRTIRTRCCEMPVVSLQDKQLTQLLSRVIKREELDVDTNAVDDIVDASNGSARAALVTLDKLMNLDPEDRDGVAVGQENETEAILLCRSLYKREGWSKVAAILRELKEEPESLRHVVLGYMTAILLKKSDSVAFHIIRCFEDNFYDSKKAGLVRACYEAIHGESN